MAGRKAEGIYPRTLRRTGRVVYDATWTVNGRKFWKKGLQSRKEAERARRDALGAADRGEHVEPSKERVGTYLEKWSASQDPTCQRYLRLHVVPALGPTALQKLTAADVRAHYRFLLEDEGLSANTVRLIHVFLRQALSCAEEDRLVVRNVAAQVRTKGRGLPEAQDPDVPDPWNEEEVQRFLRAAAEDRLFALWRLYATTGMRRNEALQLRWSDVDLTRSTVVINRKTKTRSSRRSVDLDAETVAVLRAWKKVQLEEFVGFAGGRPERVFTHETGRVSSPKDVFLGFASLKKKAKLDGRRFRVHDLRHTWATHALANGVPVKVVSERLGHANVAITLDRYQHVLPGMQRDAAEKIARLFG